jgi:hypothetical protein
MALVLFLGYTFGVLLFHTTTIVGVVTGDGASLSFIAIGFGGHYLLLGLHDTCS